METKYRLIAIRHLATKDNLANRFCSGDRDVPILSRQNVSSNIIHRIGKLNGKYLLAHTGLTRTKKTVEILGESLAYSGKILIFPEFKERMGGQLAGMEFNRIQELFPCLIKPCDLWRIESSSLELENIRSFINRIEKGLKRISKIKRNIVLIAHAGSIKGIKAVLETNNESSRRDILCQSTPKNADAFEFYL